MMKRYSIWITILICCLLVVQITQYGYSQTQKDWVIVIDPGHGGDDPGAVAGTVKEKDITLAIALKLGRKLSTMENTKVIYTRQTDTTIALYKRPQKANENKADLFVSIHCNSVESSKPYGAETWVMGLHKSKANLEVARAENSVILLEDDYKTKYDGFDPNSPEADIIFSLYQNAHLEQSVDIASVVQKEIRLNAQRFDRGVKQAGFLVLYKINMPGILVETGFVSNENERKYLTSDAGQNAIALSLFNAIIKYREKIQGSKINVAIPETGKDINHKTELTEHKQDTDSSKTRNQNTETKPGADKNPGETTKKENPAMPAGNLYYSVQFLATNKKRDLDDPAFMELQNVHEYKKDGSYKYVSGYFTTIEEAIDLKNELHKDGAFPDAFVVAFHKGKMISLSEAAQLQKKQ